MNFIRSTFVILVLLIIAISGLYSQSSQTDFSHLSSIEIGLSTPFRLSIDHEDNIYVSDVFQKVIKKYDTNGNLIENLVEGASPVSIAINPEGTLFYGDQTTGFVYKCNSNNQQEVFYSGTVYPSSLIFSPDNILYIADNKLKKVLAVDLTGELVGTIGEGLLIFPTGIAFDIRNDHVLVAEHGGLGGEVSGCGSSFGSGPLVKVYVFDRQGNALNSFGCFGNGDGKFYRMQGMTVGRCGNIYITEPFQGSINVFSETGTFITKFGEYGTGPGQLNLPIDIAFDNQERIIISCYNKSSLEIFTIYDTLPSATILTPHVDVCEGIMAELSIRLSGSPPWNITYTHNGINPTTISNINSSPYTLVVSQPGDYLINEVSDAFSAGSCISGSAHVSIHQEPTSKISCGDQIICEGTSADIPIYFTGDSPWTFTHTRDGENPVTLITTHNPYILEVNKAGLYAVTALSSYSCTGSIFNGSSLITVRPLPSAILDNGNNFIHRCEFDPPDYLSVSFKGSSPWTFTYTIDDLNPEIVQTSENPYLLLAKSQGIYEITNVSDDYCYSTNTTGKPKIIIHQMPTAQPMVTQLGLCMGTQNYSTTQYIPIQLTGVPPWTFTITWNGGYPISTTTSENLYMFPVTKLGLYQISGVADYYCKNYQAGAIVNVIPATPPSASIPAGSIPLCVGSLAKIPILFTGTPPWTFTYLHNGINPVTMSTFNFKYFISVSEPGEYKLTDICDANCSAKKMPPPAMVVEYNNPIADFSFVTNLLEVSFTNNSSNSDNYKWFFGDNTTSVELNPVHIYPGPGDYIVTLQASNNYCGLSSFTDTINLISQKSTNKEDFYNVILDNEPEIIDGGIDVRLYPNPCNVSVTVEMKGEFSDKINVEFISMAGQVLISSELNLSEDIIQLGLYSQQFDLRSLSSGVYQVQVRCSDWTIRRLLIVAVK